MPAPEIPQHLVARLNSSWIAVRIAEQTLELRRGDELLQSWPISSALAGLGSRDGSLRTPVGWHSVSEKIGDGAPLGMRFIGRVPSGQIVLPESAGELAGEDLILTRILWLTGEQPGLNQGPGIDSKSRYIYIHGTHEERLLGAPASAGCIRMAGNAVIELFERVAAGAAVLIDPAGTRVEAGS